MRSQAVTRPKEWAPLDEERQALVERYQPLAKSIGIRIASLAAAPDADDAISDALLWLCRAASEWDPNKGIRSFAVFAGRLIWRRCHRIHVDRPRRCPVQQLRAPRVVPDGAVDASSWDTYVSEETTALLGGEEAARTVFRAVESDDPKLLDAALAVMEAARSYRPHQWSDAERGPSGAAPHERTAPCGSPGWPRD